MKLSTTRKLFAYWDSLRGARLAPDRDDIDPGAIRACLADTFILACNADGDPFRLAGTAVCSLFGQELKGRSFSALWAPDSRTAAAELTQTVAEETAGAVASVTGVNGDGESVLLEMMLLPLGYEGRTSPRLLGSIAAVAAPYWLGTRRIETLALGGLRYVGPVIDPVAPPRFVAGSNNPLSGRGFVVYQGGGDGNHRFFTANPSLTPLD